MFTFQSVIDEARKQKEVIVHSLYECIKDNYKDSHYYNVIAGLSSGDFQPFYFYVSNKIENVYYAEPSIKLFTVCLGGFGEGYLSKEQLSVIFDEELAQLEKLVNKE